MRWFCVVAVLVKLMLDNSLSVRVAAGRVAHLAISDEMWSNVSGAAERRSEEALLGREEMKRRDYTL